MQLVLTLCVSAGIFGLVCGCGTPRHKAAASAGAESSSGQAVDRKTPESLASLNKLFLQSYRARQLVVKSNTSPIIFANFDSLILFWNGTIETNRVIPGIYHSLKAVDHVPFGIYLRLVGFAGETDSTVPEDVVAQLKEYKNGIGEAEASLEQAGFSLGQLSREREILSKSKSYLNEVISNGKATRMGLLDFARGVGPLLLANANDAAAAQIDLTHGAVMQWKQRIPPQDWRRLVVVVSGPQMPRRLNIFTQYFAKVLGEPQEGPPPYVGGYEIHGKYGNHLGYPLEGRRLIYAEQIFGGRDQLDLMATTFVDGDASEAFFGNRWRMSRDILADGAAEYLRGIKVQ